MKKIISISLSLLMLISILSSFSAFAEETYPPVATGRYYNDMMLKEYSFETAGENPEPISLSDSYSIQVQREDRIIDLNDEALEQQIKEDYSAFINNDVPADKLGVQYYGTLSDGSMLVFINGPFYYPTVVDYTVIGKYVYITSCRGNDIKLYKNNTFTSIVDAYLNGDLSDDLLDETAEILHFAKFVNQNESTIPQETTVVTESTTIETTTSVESTTADSAIVVDSTANVTTEPATSAPIAETTKNTSTADSAVNKTSNSNGTVQTGYNSIAVLCVIVLVISGVVLRVARGKKI